MSKLALKLIKECYQTKNPELDLGNCGLRDEHFIQGSEIDIALRKCSHLETFILSNTWFDYTESSRFKSRNIGSYNQLTVLPSALTTFTSLQALICAGDKNMTWTIIDISSISALTNLRYLNLSYNTIRDIKVLKNLTFLEQLYLYENQVTKIEGLDTLTHLQILNLYNNQIPEINGLDTLTNLQTLNLYNNQITEIKGLDKLKNLQVLNLHNNQITEIKGLDKLTNLQVLNLYNNQITEIKGLDKLTNLQTLNLYNNQITEIRGLDTLSNLQILNLFNNLISEIKGLDKLTALQQLYLHNNMITEVGGLDKLTALQQLCLSENQIKKIKALNTLTNLMSLDISNNKIENLHPLITIIQSSKNPLEIVVQNRIIKAKISIGGNPLVNPTIEVVNQGHEAIINYFRELEKQGTDYLYEAKMLIVGQPRAGKTSLRYKLFNSHAMLPKEEETTRGIDIQRISFDIPDKDGKRRQFHYNVWDFGGQQIYQTTHQFFLTHRSLYALVMDTGKDSIGNEDTTMNYWLQTVELLGGNSPLLLILNEKNERKISIDLPQKKARFAFLKEDYNIDLNALTPETPTYNPIRKKDFEDLKKDIQERLIRLPLVGFPMPANWVKIREELQVLSITKPYIKLDEYINICSRHEVTEYSKQLELSRIFHDLGVFLHFQDYVHLDNFIVLQNTWATDAVFTVLDNENVKSNKGKFTDNDLVTIWHSKGYPSEVHNRLLGLMMQFALCYQVDKSKNYSTYIVPEMLPDSAPEGYHWQPDNDLPLQYRYDFMPKGLLTRLIVRLNKYIYTEGLQQSVWKTGVKINGNFMDCPNTYAEITEAWDNKQLSIRIQGRFSKDLMSKITHEIDELNKSYFKQISDSNQPPKSKWYKMIPCNCITCKDSNEKHFYDYIELLERKDYGKDTIECKKRPFATVNISELIDGVFSKEVKKQPDRSQQDNPKKVFISYSKDDLTLVNKFIEHLSALQRDGKVAHWYCTELEAGTNWNIQIQEHLNQSNIVCFMVSPNFMRTAYIHELEIKKAFERQAKDPRFKIVPIILDFCKWTTAHNNLGQFTALPYTAKPVVDFKNQNMAWYIIQECLRLMIEKDLNPTGEDFYTSQALPKDVLKLLERIVAGKADV